MPSSFEPATLPPSPDDARSPAPADRRRPAGARALALLVLLAPGCATSAAPPDTGLDAVVASAAAELAAELAERRRGAVVRLAVMAPRATPSHLAELGRDLRHRVADRLTGGTRQIVLVERDLEPVWTEHRLSGTGLLDADSTAELGRMLGADALLLGEIVEVEERPQLHLRIVDVQTGEQLALVTRSLDLRDAAPRQERGEGDSESAKPPPLTTGPGPSTADPGEAADGAAAASEAPPTLDQRPPPAIPLQADRYLVGDFRVGPAGCGFLGSQVVCRIEVENLTPGPRTLTVLGTTRIHDTRGHDYRLQRVRLGTRVRDVVAPETAFVDTLPGSLEATLELTFSGVPRRKKKLQLVELHLGAGTCDFRDVPLSRD